MLIIFSGVPGTGKTTLSRRLAREFRAVYLRDDTMSPPIMAAYGDDIADVSYRVAYGVARDNLRLGHVVVADCVNDVNITRDAWRDVALGAQARAVEIEIVCSDVTEHRRRVETRLSDVPGLKLPSWEEICNRRSEPWRRKHVVIDTANRAVEDCLAELKGHIPVPDYALASAGSSC
jgi:predicted kinase